MRSLLFPTSEKNFEMKFEVGEETGSCQILKKTGWKRFGKMAGVKI